MKIPVCCAILFLALVCTLGYCLRKKIVKIFKQLKYEVNWESCFLCLLACSVVTTLILVTAIQLILNKSSLLGAVYVALKTVAQLLECDGKDFRIMIAEPIPMWFTILSNLLSLSIPIFTAGTVIVFVLDRFPLLVVPAQEYVVFSHLDERTILLAKDIQKTSEKKVRFLFLRAEKNQQKTDLLLQLREIPCQLYSFTESDLLTRHIGLRRKKLRFFFLDENTDENFDRLSQFLDTIEGKKLFWNFHLFQKRRVEAAARSEYQQELYLLSETASAPLLIDHLREKLCEQDDPKQNRKKVFANTELRLLDRYRAVSYHLLQTVPLYNSAQQNQNHVLLLGFGRVGQAFYRAASSFCVMSNCETDFFLCDKHVNRCYDAMLQQLSQREQNMPVRKYEFDIESKSLEYFLRKYAQSIPFTYIVIALGDDERNIQIASQLKRFYRKLFWEKQIQDLPIICVNIEDEIKSSYAVNLFKTMDVPVSGKEQDFYNHVFGTNQQTFSVDVLMPRGAWIASQKLHCALTGKDPSFLPFWSEYERRSSMASVCHAAYHIASVTGDYNHNVKAELYNARFQTLKNELVKAEHQRWMNYVRSEGMQFVDLNTVEVYREYIDSHVDISGKLTPCLVEAEALEVLYDQLSVRFDWPKDKLSFRQRDELVAKNAWNLYQMMKEKDPNKALAAPSERGTPIPIP